MPFLNKASIEGPHPNQTLQIKKWRHSSPKAVPTPLPEPKQHMTFPGELHSPILTCAPLQSMIRGDEREKKHISTTIEGTSVRRELCFECFNTQKLTPIYFPIQKPSLWNSITMLSPLYFSCMLPGELLLRSKILLLLSFIFTSPLCFANLSLSKRLKCSRNC